LNPYLETLISKYRDRGVLIDSNLLILYFVGEYSPELISRLRRTKQFCFHDYCLLKAIMGCFKTKVTTPNILTEVSNLAGDIPKRLRERFFRASRAHIEALEELYLASSKAAASVAFLRFGLTDAVVAALANQRYLVITADFPLTNYLVSIKADAINFNHNRTF
jgi:hypothetical protein